MLNFLWYFNLILGISLFVFSIPQFLYFIVGFFLHIFKRKKVVYECKNHKFAILIPARNEEIVIKNLIDSLNKQNYPRELFEIFVIADNCTDKTKNVSLEAKANVIEIFNTELIGKSYALDYAIKKISNMSQNMEKPYDAYIVFDADNVVDKDFLKYMNIEYSKGYKVVTSYRTAKNFNSSLIAGISGLLFVRESIFLQRPRKTLKLNCSISGTGFLVDAKLLNNEWKYNLLTEDIELSTDMVIKGIKCGYAKDAITYDEQPEDIKTFYKQRIRWAKGFLQVFGKYSCGLLSKFIRSLSAIDFFTFIFPLTGLIVLGLLVNLTFMTVGYISNDINLGNAGLFEIIKTIVIIYLISFFMLFTTTILEWNKLKAPFYKKILYIFISPLAVFIYAIIFIIALFKRKVIWTQIKHTSNQNIDQM
ncbi:glycosyltransferase [Mycoplasmopsis californica]|uniref:glycosyltransferase family 2 protein n=1 Tax=Mycoplasmopsis californica TaxID=2113 RepID=UPI000EB7022E|nr:glycosyltransferase family 2 protein [Mycoplasmopsis californica]BBG40802.1 glycosyltransferase [Mycoplasmopsis californica]BBG41396.1 glycosyltransferase [Mycoplasmopsis californica]BBG41989.1 glycosyltransferase [Mycoplasmopsis californica]